MFRHYLSTALRHFSRHKATTTINVLCLALGFVCFALAFGMVRYTTTADRYHEKADRTYVLTQRSEYLEGNTSVATQAKAGFGLAKHLKSEFPDIEIAARAFDGVEIPIAAGKEQRFVDIVYADPEFLDVFDLNFLSGDRRNALKTARSAVITEELAMQLYGRLDVVGESILIANRETVHIKGVVGPQRKPSHISTDSSPGTIRFALLVSIDTLEAMSNGRFDDTRTYGWLFMMSATTYLVFPESDTITPQGLRDQLPAFYRRHSPGDCCRAIFGLRPVSEVQAAGIDFYLKRDTTGISQTAILMMLGTLVLAASCLNYANLGSAQAVTRLKEIALYRVVGARRSQIVAQSFTEGLLVSLCATSVAFMILPFAVDLLRAQIGSDIGPALFDRPFWLSILLAVVGVAIVAAAYPALVAARVQPAAALKGGRVPATKRPLMHALVVVQFASASLLFIATGVMYSQNEKTLRGPLSSARDPIVRIDNLLSTARVDAQTLKDELSKHREIKSITASNVRPGSMSGPLFMARGGPEATAPSWLLSGLTVDFDFFSTMGIPFLAGRDFDRNNQSDTAIKPDSNSIIDRALAEEYGWHNPNDAIGKLIYTPGYEMKGNRGIPSVVVGVVENARLLPIVTIGSASTLYRFGPVYASSYFVRISKDDIAAGVAAIDATWRKLSPNVPLKRSFVDEEYEALYRQITSITLVFRIAAFLALLIGTLGLVGMATHSITQRTFEIGVRRTFGATARQVLGMLLRDFAKPILLANLIAWPLAFVTAKAYSSFFAERVPITVTPFLLSLLLGLSVAWLAVFRQALHAARMNPARVLRNE